MAKLTSRELGEEEVEDTRENYSYGANSIRDGISLGKNRLTRPLVTYPEIMNMKELTCYLRLPGDYPITKLELVYEKRKKMAEGFLLRELKSEDVLSLAHQSESDDAGQSDELPLPKTPIKKEKVQLEASF